MKTTKKISIALICSGILLSAITLRSAPPQREDPGTAWRSDAQGQGDNGGQRGPEFRRMRENGGGPREQVSPVDRRMGGGPPPRPDGDMDGMDGGQGPERGPRRLMQLRSEINRLNQGQKELDRLETRLNDKEIAAKLTPEQLERRKKIISLRKDLAQLEQQDLVDRVKTESDKAIKQMTDQHNDPDLPADREEMLTDMMERVKKLNAATTDFKTLSEAMENMGPPMQDGGGMGGDDRTERVHREMEMLSRRMDDLRMDMQEMGGRPDEGRRPGMEGDGQDGGGPPRPERFRSHRPPRPEDGGDGQAPPPPPPPPQS